MRLVVQDAKKGRKISSMSRISADSQLVRNKADRDGSTYCTLSESRSKMIIQTRSQCSPFVDQLDRDALHPPLHHDRFSLGRLTIDFDCVVSGFLV